jgi:tetratricopeptide (TPR) repeat protein
LPQLPGIDELDIRNWVDSRSFNRGRRYFQQGAILNARQQDNKLKAQCYGSMPDPYRVWIQLGARGIEAGECSCPVGLGGHCKHAVALLLTWLDEPDSFLEAEAIETALAKRKKADLIGLIQHMVARYPDLEELILLSGLGQSGEAGSPQPDVIRQQIKQAMSHGDYGHAYYGAAAGIANKLEIILRQGDIYLREGDWHNATTVFTTIVEEMLAQYTQIYDHDGDLIGVVYECSEKLGECLLQTSEPEPRQEILQTLVNILIYDVEIGGYGFSDESKKIVLTQSTLEEKVIIEKWVKAALEDIADEEDISGWRLTAHGRFLLELQADAMTDEQFIELCRSANLYPELLDRLLSLNRVEEATAATQNASDYELLALADLFVAHDLGDIAEELIWERMAKSSDSRLEDWLKERAVSLGDWTKALTHAESLFWQRPGTEQYAEIESIARKLDEWPLRRQVILERLESKKEYELLTRIFLLEGDIDAALEYLAHVQEASKAQFWLLDRGLNVDVAAAAEETHPREAIRLYHQEAERLIAGRGRGNYASAAEYLKRVKALYKQLDELDEWQKLLQAIKDQRPRLPAMLDELSQAGVN